MRVKRYLNTNTYFALATLLGILTGWLKLPQADALADHVSVIFVNLLKLVSLPIIFLSIVSTASGMESLEEVKSLGKKVLKYTLLTTVVAAFLALVIFQVVQPVRGVLPAPSLVNGNEAEGVQGKPPYLTYLINSIPSNFVHPFSENNVIGVLFLALIFSLAILTLPVHHRHTLHAFFSALFAAVMKITAWIVRLMPIAIWAFIALFIRDLHNGLQLENLAFYLTCVVAANLIQACVVLPLFLKWRGISPMKMAKGMFPALSVAFFTKSSAAALPMAIRCAQENLKISPKVAQFTLPLCTTINMNACAAFILTTVLFVSMSNGMTYTWIEMGAWVFIATIAAVGNAGVPMGCYFLSSAFLAAMNVPLHILGIILPFYTLIDMLESSINVWSDSCVAAVVNSEVMQSETGPAESGLEAVTT